ncbi:asialoglycoprotein receptor 2-like [Dreissena polymorpha]|uniref:asialoglycoprotein receptor 2-like n=1 Tax=Dreissena polymorpha TaxID=45954 RepID=UPI002264D281|nr:asialoglycoprotein receptor 2-like [Dreissena polymorpha]
MPIQTYSILVSFLCVCLQSFSIGFASPPRAFTSCPDNWTAFQGSCYYFHYLEQSFTEAQHACLQLNSNLVQIDSFEENQFIKDSLSHHMPSNRWWVGLSDDDIEGIWKWTGQVTGPNSQTGIPVSLITTTTTKTVPYLMGP